MTYLQAIVPLIEDAYGELWKNAKPLADKLDFKPSEATRTPLEMLQECAMNPAGLTGILQAQKMVGGPEDFELMEKHKQSLTTIEACQAHFDATKGELFAAITSFPEDKLTEDIETPWGTFPWRDFIAYCYWNPMYHTGQLAYIQMMHGDAEMH